MPTIEQLVVQIDASTELLRRELARSESTLSQFSTRTNTSLNKVDAAFSKLGSSAKKVLGVFGIGFGIQGLAQFTANAINAADAIGEASRAAGFGAERFQRLQGVFQKDGIEAEEFGKAMRTLNTRLGIFITTGAGPAEKALDALGLKQRVLKGEISTSEQLFDAVTERLGQVGGAAEQAAVLTALFGREIGSRMANQIRQGLPAMNEAAEAITGVLSDEAVANADKLADAWDRIARSVGSASKEIVIGAGTGLGALFGVDELQGGNDIATKLKQAEESLQRLTSNEGMFNNKQEFEQRKKQLEEEIALLKKRLDYQKLIWGDGAATGPAVTPEKSAAQKKWEKDMAALEEINVSASRIGGLADMRQQSGRNLMAPIPGDTLSNIGVQQRYYETAADFFRSSDSAHSVEGLEQMNVLAQFEEATRQMDEFAEASEKAKDQQRDLANAIAASFESRGFEALMSGDIGDAVKGFTKDLAELIFKLTVLQPLAQGLSGWLGGIFGGVFGLGGASVGAGGGLSFFSAGGRPPMGRPSVVGERGPELFVPDVPGTILSNAKMMSMNSGGPAVKQYFYIQAGLPPQWEAQLGTVAQMAGSAALTAVDNSQAGRR